MTTLSESLRTKASMLTMGEKIAFGSETELMIEASTQLDALSARVKNAIHDRDNAIRLQAMLESEVENLSARVKELETDRDRWKFSYHDLIEGTKAIADRALPAEQERDKLTEKCSAYASQNTNLRNDLVLAGMAREAAEQERDEAVELIRPLAILAEDSAAILSKHNSNLAPDIASLALRARGFGRRLASGPEK